MHNQNIDPVQPKVVDLEQGKAYNFEIDGAKGIITIMISAKDSGGACSYTRDTYEKDFEVPLHLHKEHDEIFSIIEGDMEWTVGDARHRVKPGTTLWIPKGTPHGFKAYSDSVLNMFYSPGGYEWLAEKRLEISPEEQKDENKMKEFRESFDIFELG